MKACYIIDSRKKPKRAWDMIIVVLAVYNTISSPLQIAFNQAYRAFSYPKAGFFIELFVDIFFLVDMILGFLTNYIEESSGEIINSPWKIAKNYLRGRFLVDLLAIIPPVAIPIVSIFEINGTPETLLE